MNNAMIWVKGCSIEDPEGSMEIVTRGTYCKKKDVHYIFYEVLDEQDPSNNVKHKVQIHPDYVKISYSGGLNQSFVLKVGEECDSLYATPYGELELVFCGREQKLREEEGKLHLYLRYDIYSAGALMSENELVLEVQYTDQ